MKNKNENSKQNQKTNYIFKGEYPKSNKIKWVFSSTNRGDKNNGR